MRKLINNCPLVTIPIKDNKERLIHDFLKIHDALNKFIIDPILFYI